MNALKPLNFPIVVLLGMHRSGTSLCSHILSGLGVYMADDVGRGVGNEEGHWERWELVSLHDRLLANLDRAYGQVGSYSPTHDLPLPRGWLAEPATSGIRKEIEGFLRAKMAPDDLFGFKDPRTCRFLPLWLQIFARLSLMPKFVICVRDPTDVALSLAKRDGIPEIAGEYRWLVYNSECFRHVHSDYDYMVVDYASWFSDPPGTIERLAKFVMPTSTRNVTTDLSSLIQPRLDHGRSSGRKANLSVASRFYEQIKKLEFDLSARPQVDSLVCNFQSYQEAIPFAEGFRVYLEQASQKDAQARRDMLAREAELADLRKVSTEAESALARCVDVENELRHARTLLQEREAELADLRKVSTEAESALARCVDVENELRHAEARLRSGEDRMRRLELSTVGRQLAASNGAERIEALTRKASSLEAILRSKDIQIARLIRDNNFD